MARIFTRKGLTLDKGEVRLPWKTDTKLDDELVEDFILNDPYYSKDKRWKDVLIIYSFDSDELNEKYIEDLTEPGQIAYDDNVVVGDDIGDDIFADTGKVDSKPKKVSTSSVRSQYDRKKRIEQFLVLSPQQQAKLISDFNFTQDIDGLKTLKKMCDNQGNKSLSNKIKNTLDNIMRKKAEKASRSVKQQQANGSKKSNSDIDKVLEQMRAKDEIHQKELNSMKNDIQNMQKAFVDSIEMMKSLKKDVGESGSEDSAKEQTE